MANFNKVILLGNLTRDPELRYLPSQMAVVDFGIAVNHKFRTAQGEDREEVMFIDCSAFGKQAEVIKQYCQKGKQLMVEGRLKLDSWDDKQTGQKRSKHKVTIENFQFVGSREGGGGGNEGGGQSRSYDEQSPPQRQQNRGPAPRPPVRPQPRPSSPSAMNKTSKRTTSPSSSMGVSPMSF
jgi:single-strand DNA-binding protein